MQRRPVVQHDITKVLTRIKMRNDASSIGTITIHIIIYDLTRAGLRPGIYHTMVDHR